MASDLVVLERMTEHVATMNLEAEKLRQQVERRVHRQTAILVAVSLLAIVMFVVNLVLMTNVLSSIHNAKDARNAAVENTAQIKDCISPTGKCYKESQQRSGVLIKQLISSIDKDAVKTQQLIEEIATKVGIKVTPPK